MDQEPQEILPILIAEDNLVSRKLLEKSLQKAGYQVKSTENGRTAFEVLKKHFYPIVITDWMMPEMNGLELCKAIRAQEFPGYVFIVLLTSLDSKDDIITGLQAGADDYLTKPFNQAELVARLNTGRRILDLEKSLKKANEEIRILSVTDPLTKVFNRGYINTYLPTEISRACRYQRSLSLIMSDIDLFKTINDTYGHQAGDLVLKTFAELLKTNTRINIDWVARYGGEEFLIVLPETGVNGAEIVAERLRAAVADTTIPIGVGSVTITASFGVTGCNLTPYGQLTAETFIIHADTCLYRAKEEGRNKVITSPPLEEVLSPL